MFPVGLYYIIKIIQNRLTFENLVSGVIKDLVFSNFLASELISMHGAVNFLSYATAHMHFQSINNFCTITGLRLAGAVIGWSCLGDFKIFCSPMYIYI